MEQVLSVRDLERDGEWVVVRLKLNRKDSQHPHSLVSSSSPAWGEAWEWLIVVVSAGDKNLKGDLMSYRSDVAFVVPASAPRFEEIENCFLFVVERDGYRLYHADSIKWDEEKPVVKAIKEYLDNIEEYNMIRLGESDEDTDMSFYLDEDPFDIGWNKDITHTERPFLPGVLSDALDALARHISEQGDKPVCIHVRQAYDLLDEAYHKSLGRPHWTHEDSCKEG